MKKYILAAAFLTGCAVGAFAAEPYTPNPAFAYCAMVQFSAKMAVEIYRNDLNIDTFAIVSRDKPEHFWWTKYYNWNMAILQTGLSYRLIANKANRISGLDNLMARSSGDQCREY